MHNLYPLSTSHTRTVHLLPLMNHHWHIESESHSVSFDSLWPHGLYSPRNSPAQNTGVGSHSLLQGIVPTQGLNPGLLHWRQILYCLGHQGNPHWHIIITPNPSDVCYKTPPQRSLPHPSRQLQTPPTIWIHYFPFSLATSCYATRATLVIQMVKNPPAMQETWVRCKKLSQNLAA